ncbi:hypothetical protein FB45DRAFT_887494 [Roridomyces roridus]|uniref:Uncharacterized protein n=1 Tax=Roridomyces roridus TaxID=1738132 RepID=A0AAD7CJ86_9AGAR|nr:hypothetical protein FB45DRAFT_887494 [Roridomyces roridus]
MQQRWSSHALRQLQLVVPGGAITHYLRTHEHLAAALANSDPESWGRTAAVASLAFGALTVLLFVYILLTPWIHGVQPDFRSWRESGQLSSVIPMLTFSIVTGFLGTAVTLGQWTDLGYPRAVVGTSAIYALGFGLLGLLPAPRLGTRTQRPD